MRCRQRGAVSTTAKQVREKKRKGELKGVKLVPGSCQPRTGQTRKLRRIFDAIYKVRSVFSYRRRCEARPIRAVALEKLSWCFFGDMKWTMRRNTGGLGGDMDELQGCLEIKQIIHKVQEGDISVARGGSARWQDNDLQNFI